jgi:carbon monoxide dehydrogenase subunit G
MIKYEAEVLIERPQPEVAAYIVDPSTHGEWMGDVAGVENLTPGEVGVGSRYRYGIRKGPMAIDLTLRVAKLDDEAIEYVTEPGGAINWAARIEYEPVDKQRTRVRSTGQMSLNGIRRLLEPLMAGEVRSGEAAELVALKRILESRSPMTVEV